MSSDELMILYIEVSSAYSFTWDKTVEGRSLMYNRNNRGIPWDKPDKTLIEQLLILFSTTCCVLLITSIILVLGLKFHNVQASRTGADVGLCQILLRDLIVLICAPASSCHEKFSIVVRSWLSHKWCFLKPCWSLQSMLWVERCLNMWL